MVGMLSARGQLLPPAQVQNVRLPYKTTWGCIPYRRIAKRTFTVQNDIGGRHKCILFASEQNDISKCKNAFRPFTGQNDIAAGFEPQNQFFTETFL